VAAWSGRDGPQQPLRERGPLPVYLLSNEDSQNSVLDSHFASYQGTMDVECEDGQLKDVQRLMEERERVISTLDPKLRRGQALRAVWRACGTH
jgi:hypothetical protein